MSSAREVLVRMLTEKDMLMYLAAAEQQVDAILRALDAAGFVVVPKEPTQQMINDGVECRQHDGSITSIWRVMVAAAENKQQSLEVCRCIRCTRERNVPVTFTATFRYACEICGNKRCPHHSDHRLACTDSNEPGQPGSVFA